MSRARWAWQTKAPTERSSRWLRCCGEPRRNPRMAEAVALSKTLRHAPDNETLLALYALYKQGSVGDVSGKRPHDGRGRPRQVRRLGRAPRAGARAGHARLRGAGQPAQVGADPIRLKSA
ncbi:acyl-CoA-binding protein [Cupriavidus necator]|uniref:acyl-CoA-binding protein n=1 Tax=Cupriavidus necator TaxID=106590 RepID=UPI002E79F9D5|nr:acyl-CoA-binding protein [Cupriavidus necator]